MSLSNKISTIKNNQESYEKYYKEVRRFFEMKTKWEMRKNKKKSNCLICNNITNSMIFEVSGDLYLAKCEKKTCKPIEILRKKFILIESKIQEIQHKLNYLKSKFIIEKMDTMFKFIDNKNAIKIFKDEFDEYRELIKNNELYNSENKMEETQNIIDEINQDIYKELIHIEKLRETIISGQNNSIIINDIIDIFNNKLTPLVEKLQNVQYPIMEMNITKKGDIKLYQNTKINEFIEIK
jgi:paraquat-inducible protein B